jgi:chromatin remodeling complex protein RSC6
MQEPPPYSTDFIPPSEEIQRLFAFKYTSNTLSPSIDSVHSNYRDTSKALNSVEDYSFTEEEFDRMPSTLMKAVRKTDTLLVQTELARKAAIETNNELKGIQSLLVRYAKKMLKDAEKTDALVESNLEKGKLRGFRRQCKISDSMCDFMGLEHGTTASRVDVNHSINEYIKTHGLIDKENAQRILPDEKLWSILSENAAGNTITYFSIQKYIKHHFSSLYV